MNLLSASRKASAVAVPEMASAVKALFSMLKSLYPVLLKTSTFLASDSDNELAGLLPVLLSSLPVMLPFITILE